MNTIAQLRENDKRALVIAYGLLAFLTVGYCWPTYLVMGASMASVSHMAIEIGPITRLTVMSSLSVPYHAVVWRYGALSEPGILDRRQVLKANWDTTWFAQYTLCKIIRILSDLGPPGVIVGRLRQFGPWKLQY